MRLVFTWFVRFILLMILTAGLTLLYFVVKDIVKGKPNA